MVAETTGGDVAVTARPADAASFRPYGRLLEPGARLPLGRRGGVLLAVETSRPGPRRTTHLVRYPEARRVVVPLRPDVPSLLLVLPPGEQPGGPPVAFLLPEGRGVALARGVWHAGPAPLADVPLLEVLETHGPADRFDRRALADLIGVPAVRVALPEEPGAPGPRFTIAEPDALTVAPGLRSRLRLACALVEGLDVPERSPWLEEMEAAAIASARATWSRPGDLTRVPGIARARGVLAAAGAAPGTRPPGEAALAAVLHGQALPREGALLDAVRLVNLSTRRVFSVHDLSRVGDRVVLRPVGVPGGPGGAAEVAALCDAAGPFAGLTRDYDRGRPGRFTTRALVVLWLEMDEPGTDPGTLLNEAVEVVLRVCGGREAGRLVTP